jgi:hypothetical protein
LLEPALEPELERRDLGVKESPHPPSTTRLPLEEEEEEEEEVERGQQEEARIMKSHPETAAGEVVLEGITTEEQENRDVRANVIELQRW